MVVTDKRQPQCIAEERRQNCRYRIPLDLRWKLLYRRKVRAEGTGCTIDLSSGGILFDAKERLPVGMQVELLIEWPAVLDNAVAVQLFVSGRVVRSTESHIAITKEIHEFRTAGHIHHGGKQLCARRPTMFTLERQGHARRETLV